MIYPELTLAAGGGIVAPRPLNPNQNPTIAIGLGGTGIECLKTLKRQARDRLHPDEPIRFLAVDSDHYVLDDGVLDPGGEYFDIFRGDMPMLFAAPGLLDARPELGWVNRDLHPLGVAAGACGIRQMGRLMIVEKAQAFVDRLCQLIYEVRAGMPRNRAVDIHILTGLGGGTGSGAFLDVCYLAREALMRMGPDANGRLFGYCFLPDVNLSRVEIAANPPVAHQIRANAWAAMKELDHCMHFPDNGGSWDQDYGHFRIGPTAKTPVDLCFLVGACRSDGAMVPDGFRCAMETAAEHVLGARHLDPAAIRGNGTYVVPGAAGAAVPGKEITTYLAARLYTTVIAPGDRQLPTDADVEQFAANLGLTFRGLLDRLMHGTSMRPDLPELNYREFTDMPGDEPRGTLQLPVQLLGPLQNEQRKLMGRVTASKNALLTPFRPWQNPNEWEDASIMRQVYYVLSDVVCDPRRGPVWAAGMLCGSGSKNLLDILNGVRQETGRAMDQARCHVPLLEEQVRQTRAAFLHPRLLQNRTRLFEEFLHAVSDYVSNLSRIQVLEELEGTVRVLTDQLRELYEVCFRPYAEVAQNLRDTFCENLALLNFGMPTNGVWTRLMSVNDLQQELDQDVAAMNPDREFHSFHAGMFSHAEIWLSGDSGRISRAVNDHMLLRFSQWIHMTAAECLEKLLQTTDPIVLAQDTYQHILPPLAHGATSMFWNDWRFDMRSLPNLGACILPGGQTALCSAAHILSQIDPTIGVDGSGCDDRVLMLRWACGVSLSVYAGLEECRAAYDRVNAPGIHLYEGTARDGRNWRDLPDPN